MHEPHSFCLKLSCNKWQNIVYPFVLIGFDVPAMAGFGLKAPSRLLDLVHGQGARILATLKFVIT